MSATKSEGLTVKRTNFTEKHWVNGELRTYTYPGYAIKGWLGGKRVRRQCRTHSEALTEKARLEVEAANSGSGIRAINTRLTEAQVGVAEAVFKLTPDPLGAVQWYLANYRPPTVEKRLTDLAGAPGEPPAEVGAMNMFLASKATEVRVPMLNDYRKTLRALERMIPARLVHTIKTEELEAFMKTLGPSKMSWNNNGEICMRSSNTASLPRAAG